MTKKDYKPHGNEPHKWNREMYGRKKCSLCGKVRPASKTRNISEKRR